MKNAISTRAKFVTYRTGKMPVLRAIFSANIFADILIATGTVHFKWGASGVLHIYALILMRGIRHEYSSRV